MAAPLPTPLNVALDRSDGDVMGSYVLALMSELRYELIGERRGRKKRTRTPPKLTESLLRRAAQRYIERYGGPTASVRDVLMRRLAKSRDQPGFSQPQAVSWVDTVITELTEAGALDDRRWAEERARALHERGFGLRRLRQKLAEKRIPGDVARAAIAAVTQDSEDPDKDAAHAYARRRRIGRYRPFDREEHLQKDLGKLARAGFSYALARDVVHGDPDGEDF